MSRRERAIKQAESSGNWRQLEDVQIIGNANDKWSLRHEGRDVDWAGVGGTWLDADNAVGEQARLGFAYGNPLMPVFFTRGSRPRSRRVMDSNGIPWPTYRQSLKRTNGIDKPFRPFEPREKPLVFPEATVIERANDRSHQFHGSEILINFFPQSPWRYDGGEDALPLWLDFTLTAESGGGSKLVLADPGLSGGIYTYSPHLSPPEWGGEVSREAAVQSFGGSGQMDWEYRPPSRTITWTWPWDTGGGGPGDPGGPGGNA